MAINVQIKQTGLFKKVLTVPEIAAMCNMKYGISDEHFRLKEGELDEYSLIYNPQVLARGIDISFDDKDINLKLSLPTSGCEIREFYGMIEAICEKLRLKEYYREGQKVSVKDNAAFICGDITASADALLEIRDKIESGETENFIILGVSNPISLGLDEIKEISEDFDNFEAFMDMLQQMDVYYAAPRIYERHDGSLIGCYAIGEDIVSVVPDKPYILMSSMKIDDWYVLTGDNTAIRYEDFIGNVMVHDRYDANHVIVCLSSDEIENYKNNFQTQL